jgi:hypothetical protein
VHLIVPFAAASSQDALPALQSLATPALDALLAQCDEIARDDGDETSLETPHERALAQAFGWRPRQRRVPTAWRSATPPGGC